MLQAAGTGCVRGSLGSGKRPDRRAQPASQPALVRAGQGSSRLGGPGPQSAPRPTGPTTDRHKKWALERTILKLGLVATQAVDRLPIVRHWYSVTIAAKLQSLATDAFRWSMLECARTVDGRSILDRRGHSQAAPLQSACSAI